MAPTATQRVDQLEEQMAGIRNTIAEEVATAVGMAAGRMQDSISTQLTASLEVITKKFTDDLNAMTVRLEGRINRNKENYEGMVDRVQSGQLQFHEEVRASIEAIRERLPTGPRISELEDEISRPEGFGGGGNLEGHPRNPEQGGGFRGSNSRERGGPNTGNWKYRKLDMPIFEGNNPDGWVLRAERYFLFYNLTEEEMLEAAVVGMDGEALLWYQWEHRRRPIQRWEELKALMLRRFRPANAGTLHEQWLGVRQTGTVAEYRKSFIELAAPLRNVSEDMALGIFLNGLREDIKTELRVQNPRDVDQAMDLAIRVEDRIRAGSASRPRPSYVTKPYPPHFNPNTNPHSSANPYQPTYPAQSPSLLSYPGPSHAPHPNRSLPPNPTPRTQNTSTIPGAIRRSTDQELQHKRERGLCYRCDDKWSAGHRCRRRELSVLVAMEGDDVGEENEPEVEEGGEPESETTPPEISLNSVVGLSNPKTMKLGGTIKGEHVVVMIDPGATHNFLSLTTLERLKIPLDSTKGFGVSLGNGEAVQGAGECKGVILVVQGITICEDFLPLNLGNSDIILGIQWLEKLGDMMTNWKQQWMKFKWGNKMVELKGDPSLGRSQISLKAMFRALQKEKLGLWVELNHMAEDTVGLEEHKGVTAPPYLLPTISCYERVFHLPTGLPPKRGREHAIVLKQGQDPVSVRPYRYPQGQKDEIERLIGDMLKAGIVRPSVSPFSSPVLLVKKKDGS